MALAELEKHEESEKKQEESEKKHEESEKKHEESEKKQEELEKKHEESEKKQEESEKKQEESEKKHEELEKKQEESEKMRAKSELTTTLFSALIDKRWESIVRPLFSDLVPVLDPDSFLDRLYSDELVTKEEYHRLRSMPWREKSRALLSDILPRKGETSYDQFVTIVRETEKQNHVVKFLGERIRNNDTIFVIDFVKLSEGETRSLAAEEKELEKKLAELEKKHAESEKKRAESEKKHAESEKKLAELEKRAKSELTNIGLRNKVILFG